jgi:peroxiredoxin
MRRNLEIVTNIAILLVAFLIVGTFAGNYFLKQSKPRLSSGLRVGQTFSQIQGVTYKESPQTLLIALSTKCGYCAASVPFYERLAESRQENPATHVVGIFPDSGEEIKQFAEQQHLSIESRTADFKGLGLNSTPTIILLDREGKVLNFWVGQLSAQGEAEVFKAAAISRS